MKSSNKVNDICPTIADTFTYTDIEESLLQNYYEFLNKNKELLGSYKYYLSKLHDSPIISMDFADNNLLIKLNNVPLSELAYNISNTDKSNSYIDFPVDLNFVNIRKVRLLRVSRKGIIKKTVRNEFKSKFTYLYDELVEISNKRIMLAIILWTQTNKRHRNPYRLLLIEAEKIEVTENHKQIWKDNLSNNYIDEYEEYRNIFVGDNNIKNGV
jgi:hypothetical protein